MTSTPASISQCPWLDHIIGLTLLLILIKMPVLMLIGQALEGIDEESAFKLGLLPTAGGEFAIVVFQ